MAGCAHVVIEARIEISFACSTIRFVHGERTPVEPQNGEVRRISISDLRCEACHKRLTKADVAGRFEPGGEHHHPRFVVSY
jgi:hypothetical protein